MKLSELIEKLSSIHSLNGDLEVCLVDRRGIDYAFTDIELTYDEEYVEIFFT